jgi:parallel beta-helix repeat protein
MGMRAYSLFYIIGPLCFVGCGPVSSDQDAGQTEPAIVTSQVIEPQELPAPIPLQVVLVPSAGEDFRVYEGQRFKLDGTATSYDGSELLTFKWRQVDGPDVELESPNSSETHLVAPQVESKDEIVFSLTVRDDVVVRQDYVAVKVLDLPPPHAVAGVTSEFEDFAAGDVVTLDASNSMSADGGDLEYHWTQLSGIPVTLDADASITQFEVPRQGGAYAFELKVVRGELFSTTTIEIEVPTTTAPISSPTPGPSPAPTPAPAPPAPPIVTPPATPQPDVVTIEPTRVVGFSLVNAERNEVIPGYEAVSEGVILRFDSLPQLNLQANTEPATVGSVAFRLYANGHLIRSWTENGVPYSLYGDDHGDFHSWPALEEVCTDFKVEATPYSYRQAQGVPGVPATLSFRAVTVLDDICQVQTDCDDGIFCNGTEECTGGTCLPGPPPCEANNSCVEDSQTCELQPAAECASNAACDDGRFCNGPEICMDGQCTPALAPCGGLTCDEDSQACLSAAGSTYIVDANVDGANSAEPVGSFANPFSSFEAVDPLLKPGDTVLIRGGRYKNTKYAAFSGTIEVTASGAPGLPITIQNYPGESVIVDADSGDEYFAVRLGNPVLVSQSPAKHLVIRGLTVTGALRNGIYAHKPVDVTIQHCTAYGNNQAYETFGELGATAAGIHLRGGERCTVEHCRVYGNGYGIMLYESVSDSDPVGSKFCTIRNNFVYSNANAEQYGNAGGIDLRFTEDCLVQNNVLWDCPDGSILGLGPIRNKVIGNVCLHSWQYPGNNEGIKLSVRGGGGNLIAFNIVAFNNQRGIDIADGIGEILINNTSYANAQWGYLLQGQQTLLFNSLGDENFPSAPDASAKDFAMASTWQFDTMHPSSDNNFFGDALALPDLQWGHVQDHSLSGDSELVLADWAFDESGPRNIRHPEQIFLDLNGDGTVSIDEALLTAMERFTPADSSRTIGNGKTTAEISDLIAAAIPDVIRSLQGRVQDWQDEPSLQRRQAVSMWRRLIQRLTQTPGEFSDLSELVDLTQQPVSPDEPLNIGAVGR